MSQLPQEYIDAFVEFASLQTSWDHWPHWFAMHADRLCRVMDREQFRLIRSNPKVEVPRFLAANGVTVTCADPFYTETPPNGDVTDTEYAIYTSLFQTDLFVFNHGNTSIDDHTGIVCLKHSSFKVNFIRKAFREAIGDAIQLFASFCSRNGHRYPLRPQFDVPNGYTLGPPSKEGGSFVISRAGTNELQTTAVVYIGYFGGPLCGVGYLIGLRNVDSQWLRCGHTCMWVS